MDPQRLKDRLQEVQRKLSPDEMLKAPHDDNDRLAALSKQLGVNIAGGDAPGRARDVGSARDSRGDAAHSSDAGAETPGGTNGNSRPIVTKRATLKELSLRQQIWAIMDDPSSSRAAQVVAGVVMGVIVLSCTAFVIQTLPEYVFSGDSAWAIIEDICITVFTVEFLLRISTTPSVWKFVKSPLNIIDFLAILPFYVELLFSTSPSGSAIIRIIRLVRIFRIFKISRYLPWVRVFTNALALSLQPLLMLVLVVMIAMVLFSSVIYYAERGEWSEEEQMWMRVPQEGDPLRSPYQSIPASFWWCIVTMTTVGYGDVVPITPLGRFIASVASLSGILVVAIPVSIISTNFNSEYAKLQRQKEQVKARMLLLKRMFRERKSGLDAVLEEISDIVLRNTREFQDELGALFDQARLELTEELQEILRMAYERRRQLHLAALAAGRVQSSVVVTNQMAQLNQMGGGFGNRSVGSGSVHSSPRAPSTASGTPTVKGGAATPAATVPVPVPVAAARVQQQQEASQEGARLVSSGGGSGSGGETTAGKPKQRLDDFDWEQELAAMSHTGQQSASLSQQAAPPGSGTGMRR